LIPTSLLIGDNADFLDEAYRAWLRDPDSVDADWRQLFEGLDESDGAGISEPPGPRRTTIFSGGAEVNGGSAAMAAAIRQGRVGQFINSWRVRGHMVANIDPLKRREIDRHVELSLEHHHLSESDLNADVPTHPLFGMPDVAPLRAVVERLKEVYGSHIAAEVMNINDHEQKLWVLEQLETLPYREVMDRDEELRVLRKLCDAENFERLVHTRFPGTKRFSLEGAETLIPLLDILKTESVALGVREIVFGMAHRGRLNVLVNTLEKPAGLIIREFEGVTGMTQGSGDVKYHLGYSSDIRTQSGEPLHLSLTPNPSHLEAVSPVVEGRVRAKQDRIGDSEGRHVLPVLIHGDAAFSGQGVVSETLQLSELDGYQTGGTIHLVVNNQIGFTTQPRDSRSTPYCTDVARMLAIPIFHVNGEDPRAVAAAVKIAVAWRQRYHRDVVIDMYCYRLHGHNEGDEPSFTQPLMYDLIRSRDTPREVYAQRLTVQGYVTKEDIERIHQESRQALEEQTVEPDVDSLQIPKKALSLKAADPDLAFYEKRVGSSHANPCASANRRSRKGLWELYLDGNIRDEIDTGVPLEELSDIMRRANHIPDDFKPHRKVKRLVKQRLEMVAGTRPIDWAVAEQAAFATLLMSRRQVRLSGQDSARGTFSQRHAVWTDVDTAQEYFSLAHLSEEQASFRVVDSSLSEMGVLGFEMGYAMDTPEGLILWEAQFGDFSNGAQIIIDQFVVASEQKWHRLSALVMLLPHGYEGQGPEHSSARLERYLLMCAQENIQVANCTTPANYFHILRRQALRFVRKPLVIMTPKSLLRHAVAVSTLDDLVNGAFQAVIPELDDLDPQEVRRVVFCSGKIYYELLAERRKREDRTVALIRVELLYPWPDALIDQILALYPASAEIFWCQEEPKNMGAWPVILHWMMEHIPHDRLPTYVGRPAAASPAGGYHKAHVESQRVVIDQALR
jgi:2-oxoglutarate dehydrogenase E1 component